MAAADSILRPEETAVLLVDHQTHLFVRWAEADYLSMRRNAQVLAQLAKIFQLPLILVAVRGGKHHQGGPVLSELTGLYPQAVLLQTTKLNVWEEERVRQAVRQTGRTSIIMAGVCADFGTVLPAIQATEAGYAVRVALEASGNWNPVLTQTVISRLNQANVAATTWLALAGELQADWSHQATGEPLLKLVQQSMPHWVSPNAQTRLHRRHDSTITAFGKLFG